MRMDKPPLHGTAASDCKPRTTFVQTNSDAFREVVQRLTGPSEAASAAKGDATTKLTTTVKRTTTKLDERRKYIKPKLEIVKPSFHNNKTGACLSPSKSRSSSFPPSPSSLLPSPTTPSTLFSRLTIMEEESAMMPEPELNTEEEEDKAIRERRFYLHPSPRAKPGYTEPELLDLFPLTSPNTYEKL